MKRNQYFFIGFVVLLIGFGAFLFGTSTDGSQSKAPDFTLPGIGKTTVRLSDYKGKVIILDFWATWCPPCRAEIPGFIKLQEKYGDRLQIIGVSVDQNGPAAVEPFARKYGINYPIAYADGRVVQAYGGITGIPTTFVIDPDFKIRRKYVGYQSLEVFERDIQALAPQAK